MSSNSSSAGCRENGGCRGSSNGGGRSKDGGGSAGSKGSGPSGKGGGPSKDADSGSRGGGRAESKGTAGASSKSAPEKSAASENKGGAKSAGDKSAKADVAKSTAGAGAKTALNSEKVSVEKMIADALVRESKAPAEKKADSQSIHEYIAGLSDKKTSTNDQKSGVSKQLADHLAKSSAPAQKDFCPKLEKLPNGGYKFGAIPDTKALSPKQQMIGEQSKVVADAYQTEVNSALGKFSLLGGSPVSPVAATIARLEMLEGVSPQIALEHYDRTVSLGIGKQALKEAVISGLGMGVGKIVGAKFGVFEGQAAEMLAGRGFNSVDMTVAGLNYNGAAAAWSGAKSTVGAIGMAVPGAALVEKAMGLGPIAADAAHGVQLHEALEAAASSGPVFDSTASDVLKDAFHDYGGGHPAFESLVTKEGLFYLGSDCPWSAH